MSYQRDREEFVAAFVLAMHGRSLPRGKDALSIARAILRHANTVQRLAIVICNEGLDEREMKLNERSQAAIRGLCEEVSSVPGRRPLEAHFQGDPRGACVKLRLPSGRSNDAGGEGLYCVPTRVK